MDLFAILGICGAISGAISADPPISQAECEAATAAYQAALQSIALSAEGRDAIARVAFAEAANQGDSGLAGVVYTILNRMISGHFGVSVSEIVNAPGEFEPVSNAGGWRRLPTLSPAKQARINTIINLALDGRLPDLTNGGLYFQNPAIVGQREAAGAVSKGLTHFGGSPSSAVIQDHTFYTKINTAKAKAPVKLKGKKRPTPKSWDIYKTPQQKTAIEAQAWDVFASGGAGKTVLIGS